MIHYYALPGLKYHPKINRVVTPERIVFVASSYFNKPITRINNRSNKHELVLPRQICVYLLKKYTTMFNREIAELFGYSQASAARDAYKKCCRYMLTDANYRNLVNEIESLI